MRKNENWFSSSTTTATAAENKVVLNFFFFFYCYFRFDSFNVVIVQYKIYIRTSAHSQMIKCRKKISRSCLYTVSRAANTQQIGCDNFLAQALSSFRRLWWGRTHRRRALQDKRRGFADGPWKAMSRRASMLIMHTTQLKSLSVPYRWFLWAAQERQQKKCQKKMPLRCDSRKIEWKRREEKKNEISFYFPLKFTFNSISLHYAHSSHCCCMCGVDRTRVSSTYWIVISTFTPESTTIGSRQ